MVGHRPIILCGASVAVIDDNNRILLDMNEVTADMISTPIRTPLMKVIKKYR